MGTNKNAASDGAIKNLGVLIRNLEVFISQPKSLLNYSHEERPKSLRCLWSVV